MSKFQRVIAARWVKSLWLVALLLALTLGQRAGHAAEMRFALVIGNDEYKSTKLATPANDAGLVANALTAAGFTVTGARNLDQATLRESIREFLGQVAAAGPDAVAVIYLAGFGVQFAGENYYVPVDADLAREADLPLQAVRISDFAQPLAALPARVKIVILDAARQNPFAQGGEPLASGLALVDPAPGMAIAFNAAPGTIGPEEPGPYGAYATALTEMIAAGGLPLDDVFARVRLRVSEVTNGGEVPWYASQINTPFFFTERSADAPPPPDVAPVVDLREKPMRSYSRIEDAYAAALALDTIDGYEQFLALHPRSRYARRIAAMIAVRREEIIWRRCVFDNTPPAYWSYLRRYPNGPHVWDARRRLAMIGAELEGPPDFAFVDFGVPPPPPEELVVVDRPVVTFWGAIMSRRRRRRCFSCRRGRASSSCCRRRRRRGSVTSCRRPRPLSFQHSSDRRRPWSSYHLRRRWGRRPVLCPSRCRLSCHVAALPAPPARIPVFTACILVRPVRPRCFQVIPAARRLLRPRHRAQP